MQRVFRGETVGIVLGTYTPGGHPLRPPVAQVAAWPTSAPTVWIYHLSGATATQVATGPMYRQHQQTGWHGYRHRCERTGVHAVMCQWTSGGITSSESAMFNVVAERRDPAGTLGTSQGSGEIISMGLLERPEVQHVVWETEEGELVARQNPH